MGKTKHAQAHTAKKKRKRSIARDGPFVVVVVVFRKPFLSFSPFDAMKGIFCRRCRTVAKVLFSFWMKKVIKVKQTKEAARKQKRAKIHIFFPFLI